MISAGSFIRWRERDGIAERYLAGALRATPFRAKFASDPRAKRWSAASACCILFSSDDRGMILKLHPQCANPESVVVLPLDTHRLIPARRYLMRGHRPYVGAQDDHRAAGSKQKIQNVMDRWLGGLSRPRCVSLRHRNEGRIRQGDGQSRTTTKLFGRVQYGFTARRKV